MNLKSINIKKYKILTIFFAISTVILVGISIFLATSLQKAKSSTSVKVAEEKVIKKDPKKELLNETLKAFYDAYKYSDYESMYEFTSPEDKKLVSKDKFVNKNLEENKNSFTSYKIDGISPFENSEDSVLVHVTITGEHRDQTNSGLKVTPITSSITNKFVFENGKWFRSFLAAQRANYGIIN